MYIVLYYCISLYSGQVKEVNYPLASSNFHAYLVCIRPDLTLLGSDGGDKRIMAFAYVFLE